MHDPDSHQVVIIGGGQAGLSMSHYLKGRGVEHVVFEKNKALHVWRTRRWDSFCLVTPNCDHVRASLSKRPFRERASA